MTITRAQIKSHIQLQSNAYIPQGLRFDGSTGLVTLQPLVTFSDSQISFAGWFNIVPPPIGSKLRFSQGDSSGDTLYDDAAIPSPTWCHMMGTIDAAINQIVLAINGAAAGGTIANTGTVPFSFVPTNGKLLTIGTDGLGNFFTGDMADLSIWFDTSWIVGGVIPSATIARFIFVDVAPSGITTISPKNPSFALFTGGRRPDIFLSGPASAALEPHLPTGTIVTGVLPLKVLAGVLQDSFSNPTKVFLTPA